MARAKLTGETYRRLLALRTGMRHFERWSEQQAQAVGLTSAQHQLLLAIRGHADSRGPTVGEIADYLFLQHNSVVGLIDRAVEARLVFRTKDEDDHRIVRLRLSAGGLRKLEALSALHVEELKRLGASFPSAWTGLASVQRSHGLARTVRTGNTAGSIEAGETFSQPGDSQLSNSSV